MVRLGEVFLCHAEAPKNKKNETQTKVRMALRCDQSRSWSAEQRKENKKRKSAATPPPPRSTVLVRRK